MSHQINVFHQVKCIRTPFNTDMEPGNIYCYTVLENVVEYSGCGYWAEKKYVPCYAWANALMQGEIVNVNDLPQDEEN
jgi:hypothetical protein